MPYLKSLTLDERMEVFYTDRLVRNQLHCQELRNIGDMLVVWNLEYLNLSFNRGIAGHLSVLLRHGLPFARNSCEC